MRCCNVMFCLTKKCEAVTTEPTGPVAGPEVPLVIHSSTETSRVGGRCCMRPGVELPNRIPFVSQTDTLVLCRQRCGLHCSTSNPGNAVNKELLLFLLFFFFVCHDVLPHGHSQRSKGPECGRSLDRSAGSVVTSPGGWRVITPQDRGQAARGHKVRSRSRFWDYLQEVGTSDAS